VSNTKQRCRVCTIGPTHTDTANSETHYRSRPKKLVSAEGKLPSLSKAVGHVRQLDPMVLTL
jgi:hypothetical protein